jgi:hypothetical protein
VSSVNPKHNKHGTPDRKLHRLQAKAKFPFLCLAFFCTTHQSFAQFVLEPFVSPDEFILESWYFNTIDENKRFSIFNLNEAKYNFESESSSAFSYGILGYDLVGGFGPLIGWRVSSASAAALTGVQYGLYRKNFLAYFTFNVELKNDPNIELYSLLQCRPQLSPKLKGFSQFQISKNFTTDDHTFSLYRLRLGIDLGKIQTGLGLEQTMVGSEWDYNIAPGAFVRLELY